MISFARFPVLIYLVVASVKALFYEAANALIVSLQCELNGSASLYNPDRCLWRTYLNSVSAA